MEELPMNVQAYILNISGIKTLEELMELEANNYMHTVDAVISVENTSFYTAPRWIMNNDIVFFYHATIAKQDNKRLRRYIKNNINQFSNGNEKYLFKYLNYCDKLYDKYGGKIYAVGKVSGNVEYSKTDYEHPHFRSRIFAPITNIVELDYPLSAEKFKDFLPIARQTGITPVLGNDFMKLKLLLLKYNNIFYLKECVSASIPIKDVKKGNWLQSANENKRRYLYESQFRKYYVDYMLMSLSDDNNFLSEISCVKDGKVSGRADNCIKFNEKYLFVEVKLNVFAEDDIFAQLEEYCNVNNFKCGNRKISSDSIYQNFVLLIDVNKIYFYNVEQNEELIQIEELDNIKSMVDVRKLKEDMRRIIDDI